MIQDASTIELDLSAEIQWIDNHRFPIIINHSSELTPLQYYLNNQNKVEQLILKHGGVLLRNFQIHSLSEFNQFAQTVRPDLLDYVYRSTPRTKLGGKIYSATEYPSNRRIPLHNEFSYFSSWPEKIFFFCVIAPTVNGQTPICDSRLVYNSINPEITKLFNDKKVMYRRNYNPHVDLPWQTVFQTENSNEVEAFCETNGISYRWTNNGECLSTEQICQATTTHPKTGESVWFNQAHLFHISSLSDEDQKTLLDELGYEHLTRNSFFGDGSEIPIDLLDHIRAAYDQHTFMFDWQRGDIMVLDNVLMAHGRNTYSGERKLAVAMG